MSWGEPKRTGRPAQRQPERRENRLPLPRGEGTSGQKISVVVLVLVLVLDYGASDYEDDDEDEDDFRSAEFIRNHSIGMKCSPSTAGLSMNRSLKSGSKLHALQTLRAGMWLVHFAKRLECVRLAGVLGVQSAKSSFGEFSPQGEGESLSALGNSLLKDLAQLGNWLFPVLGERVSSLLKNVWFAAWGHAAYKISSEISMPCRPGALTGRLFQRALKARASISSNLICGVVPMKQCHTRRRENS